MNLLLILFIPLVGTMLGAGCIFLIKERVYLKVENFLSSFAAGVMFAASIFSLILPSIDLSYKLDKFAFIPAVVGFAIGIAFLVVLDTSIDKIYSKNVKNKEKNLKQEIMLTLAVTLHNIPEGMAIGIMLAGAVAKLELMTLVGALSLCIGIAIQNIPEGAIVANSLRRNKVSVYKSFMYAILTGIVEVFSAFFTIILTRLVTPVLPYFLSFAAGAMMYVVVENLIPDSYSKQTKISIIGFSLGFCLMMALDIALG